jgi:hypothetical protein
MAGTVPDMATRDHVMQQILDKMSTLLDGDWHSGWMPADAVENLADAFGTLADLDDYEDDEDYEHEAAGHPITVAEPDDALAEMAPAGAHTSS